MSEKKLSYKPGFALLLWGVLALMVVYHNKAMIHELSGDNLQMVSVIVFVCFTPIVAGLGTLAAVSGAKGYERNLIEYAKVNEDHLCPDCAKYMNDNKYKISRI
jgi:hypothetical protein